MHLQVRSEFSFSPDPALGRCCCGTPCPSPAAVGPAGLRGPGVSGRVLWARWPRLCGERALRGQQAVCPGDCVRRTHRVIRGGGIARERETGQDFLSLFILCACSLALPLPSVTTDVSKFLMIPNSSLFFSLFTCKNE